VAQLSSQAIYLADPTGKSTIPADEAIAGGSTQVGGLIKPSAHTRQVSADPEQE